MCRLILVFILVLLFCGCETEGENKEAKKKKKIDMQKKVEFKVDKAEFLANETADLNRIEKRFPQDKNEVINSTNNYFFAAFLDLKKLRSDSNSDEKLNYFSQKVLSKLEESEKQKLYFTSKKIEITLVRVKQSDIEEMVIYYNTSAQPVFTVIDISLEAEYKFENNQKARLSAQGKLFLEKENSEWKITSYQLKNEVKT